MMPVFADSFYFFAILNPTDAAHEKAMAFSQTQDAPIITTAWVLTELADGLSASSNRRAFHLIIEEGHFNTFFHNWYNT